MLPGSCLVAITLIGIVQATHVDWDNYRRWSYTQGDRTDSRDQKEDYFQGYPTNYPPLATTPDLTTTETAVPGHRDLLKGLFQQVLGPNFTSPGLMDLAFLSSATPSLPLKPDVWDDQQRSYDSSAQGPYEAQAQHSVPQYELPEYIQPPPPPATNYDYYYQ